MINLFPPGGVSALDGHSSYDNLTLQEAQAARERKLREYFEDGVLPNEHEKLFVAFAETHFELNHLDDVALFHDYFDWHQFKDSILSGSFNVPDVRTHKGYVDARKMLLESTSSR